ncbi:hypothetical protein C8Q80DRAFT_123871 [Daedaleopsis nitida]|nr:hypothetical protein C8Q80DRAFT_123871 [Daedaleopsis nitida]
MRIQSSMLPSPSSQKVLYNLDLLDEIFECFFRPPTPLSADKQKAYTLHKPGDEELTLSRAARVCKSFTQPALRVLWWSIPSLVPLLRTLPSLKHNDIQRHKGVGRKESYAYILDGDITPENGARMREYATLVREVRFDADSIRHVHSSVFSYLAHHFHGECLLPNLHTLSLHSGGAYEYRDCILRLPSSTTCSAAAALCTYCFSSPNTPGEHDTAADTAYLNALARHAPSLAILGVHGVSRITALLVICPLMCLRILDLGRCSQHSGTANVDLIRTLASMPELEVIDNLMVYFDDEHTPLPLDATGFRKLKSLSVETETIWMPKLLAAIKGPLRELCAIVGALPGEWDDAFAAMVPHMRHVRVLVLEAIDYSYTDSYNLADFLAPFTTLAELEELYVYSVPYHGNEGSEDFLQLNADDAQLAALAHSWPHLHMLALDVQSTTPVTLHGIGAVAAHCPALETLLLPHLRVPAAPAAPPRMHHTALRCLSVYDSEQLEIADCAAAAAALVRMFPFLDGRASEEVAARRYMGSLRDRQDELTARRTRQRRFLAGREVWQETVRAMGA